ncbi:MAG: pilus assembly protein [Planctomycetes bacterium]|nr:pilus assembly protein [Planctomycetota bacterium]
MALTAPATSSESAPSPASEASASGGFVGWCSSFHRGEEATGATEFLILLPVYILFLIGLFSMGNLMIVRQSLVSVTRNYAWTSDQKNASLSEPITGPYRGTLTMKLKTKDGFVFSQGGGTATKPPTTYGGIIKADMFGPARTDNAAMIAVDALNNADKAGDADQEPFEIRVVFGEYQYDGLNFGPSLTQGTDAAVMLPRKPHTRTVYKASKSSGNNHVAVQWPNAKPPFDPSTKVGKKDYRPLNPVFKTKSDPFFSGEDGIWDKNARINGSTTTEHKFFDPGGPK